MIPMRDNRIGAIQVALGAIFWSCAGVLGKWLPWNALTINGIRSLVAVILLGIARKSFRVRLSRGTALGSLHIGCSLSTCGKCSCKDEYECYKLFHFQYFK